MVAAPTKPLAPARSLPSTLPLERIISQWDFYKDVRDNKIVEDPDIPSNIPKPEKLPLFFESPEQFIAAYERLFLLETNNMVHRSKEQVMEACGEKMALRKYVLPKVGAQDPESADDFLQLTLEKTEHNERKYGGSDIVLLSVDPDPRKECDTHCLAFVEAYSFGQLHVRIKLIHKGDVRSKLVAVATRESKAWYVTKVDSCSTLFREFVSLHSFPKLFLKDYLMLSGKDESIFMEIPDGLTKTLESRFNRSQLAAIHSSRKSEGITLIQGPPGTGKTSTIIGILSVLLQCKGGRSAPGTTAVKDKMDIEDESSTSEDEVESKARRTALLKKSMSYMHAGFEGSWMDNELYSFDMKTCRQFGKPVYIRENNVKQMWKEGDHAIPQKVLVTAPSNGAVDEIIRRLVQDGLISADGCRKTPRLVRCGPNVHETLQPHSLNFMATARAKSTGGGTADQGKMERAKQQILDEAQIILATNSVAGSRDLLHYSDDFDTVVIDEASQGVELSTLIPLIAGCRRLILVGDPKQLPATVFSQAAKECGYDRSLFQRLQESAHPVNMLNEQFRMHPQIAMFPSSMFYDSKLKSHYSARQFEEKFPAPWTTVPCFAPVTFFHVPGKESMMMQSYSNEAEADFILHLVQTVKKLYEGDLQWIKQIGVISPYQEQVKLIRKKFKERMPEWVDADKHVLVDISTVDGFQGREKEVIIVSTVRADATKNSIGFLRDVRRMNVAFTRPRRSLWVVGHSNMLKVNDKWASFLDFVEDKCSKINVRGRVDTFLYRYLHGYYQKNPHLTPPAALAKLPKDGEAPVEQRECELSQEEIAAIIAKQQMNSKYRQADLRGDIEDDYADLQDDEVAAAGVNAADDNKPTPMDVDVSAAPMDVEDGKGDKKDNDEDDI
eukprot:GEMP01011430.1.p1 GENE.GEMP01011430.1~~GEMP01011430.1.p1  ORF type:complete len:895 (+),score=199.26 GEMP01011430.1:243-2927(+)